MKTLFLDEIRTAVGARVHGEVPLAGVTGISTDSRSSRQGDLFFAIRGPNFDGHEYVEAALATGAAGVVVDKRWVAPESVDAGRVLVVEDTVTALGKLGAYYRDQLACTVIAVTGSNGKTTTREMIHHILSKRLRGRRSVKSYNNQIGVPLTLLEADEHDDFLVVEAGTNHPGEIDYLGNIIRPDIAVITNIGESHLEGLGTLERVAAEKASLAKHVRPGGAIVVNGDRDVLPRLITQPQIMVIRFGTAETNDMRISAVTTNGQSMEFEVNKRFRFHLPVLGTHNALNCLAAIVVARRLGFEMEPIDEALKDFILPAMRLEVTPVGPFTVLNDAYNANPVSMKSALEVLTSYPTSGRRVFCCGQMRELGPESEKYHRELGRRIGSEAVDVLVAVGESAGAVAEEAVRAGLAKDRVWSFTDSEAAGRDLKKILVPGDLVLVKGSRAMKMERLIEQIKSL